MVGDKPATIKSAGAKQIIALVPEGVSGEQLVSVAVAGFPPTKGIKITVQAAPEVTGIDMISAPPGNALTISGKGFSLKSGENQVLIGGVQAAITSVSATSISVVIPEMESPQWGVSISVVTNKVPSKGNVTINVQRRAIPNDGVPES